MWKLRLFYYCETAIGVPLHVSVLYGISNYINQNGLLVLVIRIYKGDVLRFAITAALVIEQRHP